MEKERTMTPGAAPKTSLDNADLRGVVLDGRYEIGEPLSTGGMGTVYRGQQLALRRPVAIKLVKPGVRDRELHVRRLVREAQTTAMVKHPNVIEIIDVGVMQHGFVYLVMEQLEGQDLRTLLRKEGALPWPRVRNIAMQVVAALKAAHARGVIHRDIKPSNVLLVEQAPGVRGDFIKVLDFGLAKCNADGRTPTLTGAAEVVGTAAYLAPEVARGRKADFRSEVYAVGVLMYKMATGTVPFKGSNPLDVLAKAISNPVPAPRTRNPDLSDDADRLIRKCLAKRPDLRPKDMDALEQLLHAMEQGPVPENEASGQPPRGASESTQVSPVPLAPPPSAPRVEARPALSPPAARTPDEDPSDVLEAAISEVLELDVDDVLDLGGERGSKPPLRLVPDPEPSPLPAAIPDPVPANPSLGPVLQSQTAVAPAPLRPDGFAGDLPRDARGFAPALDTAAPALPPFEAAEFESAAPPARRGGIMMLALAVPLVIVGVAAGLWALGLLPGATDDAASVSAAAIVDVDESVAAARPVTWDEGFRATPVPDPPRVYAPATYTPPSIRRPEPGEPMPALAEPPAVAQAEAAAEPAKPAAKPKPRPSAKRKKKRTARPAPTPKSTSRPPPPPPGAAKSSKRTPKKKRPASDGSAPWKRVPVPSDNW
ncbi:MAG: protein kinase domain-containing protein [Nannocystaceae bacterium]|nr:protein kinase [bacterium]